MTGPAMLAIVPTLPVSTRGSFVDGEETRFYISGFVKWRNQLLALFCLLVFFAFGIFYFQHWVVQKPFGIILFIGQGLDPTRLTLARIHAAGVETPLTIDSLPYAALLKNYSLDSIVPDQAAAATALATGGKVRNGTLGIDAEGKSLSNLFELARESGRMTGLVTTALLTDPVPAAFYAHTTTTEDRDELARTLVEKAEIDVVLGGGAADFLPARKEGRRRDDRDLVLESRGTGYDFVQTLEELEAVPRWRRAKLFGLFSRMELAFADDVQARGDQPSLADLVRRSIELLQFNSDGYLLVVDAGLMGRAARARDTVRTISETVELDRAVAVALDYAGTKSAVIVCSDVAISGLTLSGVRRRSERGAEWLERAAGGNRIIWGNSVPQWSPATAPQAQEGSSMQSENHAEDVIAFGTGLGADALHGIAESTAVFEIIRDNL